MNSRWALVVLMLVAAAALTIHADEAVVLKAGAWDSVAKAAGSAAQWFKDNVKSAKDMFSTNKKDLEKIVDDTLNFLQATLDSVDILPADLKKELQSWITKLREFKQKVSRSTDAQFASLEQEWEAKVTPIYNDVIVPLVGKRASGPAIVSMLTVGAAVCFAVLMR